MWWQPYPICRGRSILTPSSSVLCPSPNTLTHCIHTMVLFFTSTGKKCQTAPLIKIYLLFSCKSSCDPLYGSGQGRKWGRQPVVIIRSRLKAIRLADEDLIKYAPPQDIWFHVDKLSSAHVYIRKPENISWEAMPEALLTDCAQLVKANSIEGMDVVPHVVMACWCSSI